MPKVQLTADEKFFYEHAPWSHGLSESPNSGRARCAILLADAERKAKSRGWVVAWEIDYDADEPESGNPPWEATLWDTENNLLGSLGGISFAEYYVNTPQDDPYARVIAAQLASTALHEGEGR